MTAKKRATAGSYEAFKASKKGWTASATTVPVKCPVPKCETRGVAAENAISDTTPHSFRATCPIHDAPLVKATK